MIEVRLDHHLHVRKADLPIGHEEQIKQRLTVVNGEKAAARKRGQWGWQELPDSFALYAEEGPWLVMPRGFAAELRAGLELSGHVVRWDDQTAAPSLPLRKIVQEGPILRDDQEKACRALLMHRQGVLQAGTGGGKTVTVLEAWRRTGLSGLILVEKGALARQWRERAVEHLGIEPGIIGEGEWDERPLTVAMLQTLHRREIADVWFRRWGFTCADECVAPGSLVSTPCGAKPIEEIAAGDDVLGVDHRTGDVVVAVVRRTMRRVTASPLVYIAGVEMTPNHPVWTPEGYMYAGDITGDAIVFLHERHQEGQPSRTRRPEVRELLSAVQGSEGAEILRQVMRRRIFSFQTGQSIQGRVWSRDTLAAKEEESWRTPQGRARIAYSSAAVLDLGLLRRRDGEGNRSRQLDLVNRCGAGRRDAGDRGRRAFTYIREAEGARCAQRFALAIARVDGGARDQYADLAELGVGSLQDREREVFNIETSTGNYFVGGLLTHNCHHLAADSYSAIMARVWSRYLIGVTATPLEGEWTQPLLTRALGPIVHVTTPETLRRAGVRVTPLVRRVRTGWRWVPANAREEALVDTKAIYRHVIKALESDDARILKIGQTIVAQSPQCAQLVVSKRIGYLDKLDATLRMLGYQGEIMMYRGSESLEARAEVAEAADAGGCVILATVADEGVDIGRLDRLHLVWPQRKALTITQQIGRVLRVHPDKRGCVIYDYVDDEGMLASQARARARVYRAAGYAIEEERDMQGSLT